MGKRIEGVAFEFHVGVMDGGDSPYVSIGVYEGQSEEPEVVTAVSAADAATVALALLRASAGAQFSAALEKFAVLREVEGDEAGARALRLFQQWYPAQQAAGVGEEEA